MRIVLVRHADAEPKKNWIGDDADRPLTARGRRQAKSLASVIGRPRPTLIVASPAARCRQTVEPLATSLNLAVKLAPALARDAGVEAHQLLLDLSASLPEPSTLLLCTHREVIQSVLPVMARESGRALGHRLPGAKSAAWVLELRSGELRSVTYRPPSV